MLNNKTRIINQLAKDFPGHIIPVDDAYETMMSTTQYVVVGELELSPASFGPVAHMFKSCKVEIKAGICPKGNIYYIYEYSYKHPDGGTNGYTHRFDNTQGE